MKREQGTYYFLILAAGLTALLLLYAIVRPEPAALETAETVEETAELTQTEEVTECFIVVETKAVKVGNFEPTTVTVTTAETVETVETSSEAPETVETSSEPAVTFYSCHGIALAEDLQRLAFEELEAYGMAEYYPIFLCQAFQESSYQADQRTLNNGCYDCGLMQIREKYWAEWETEAGWSGDIMVAGDNVRMACYILSRYWIATGGDVEQTISMYMSGWSGEWQGVYVSDVLSHLDYLEVINGK